MSKPAIALLGTGLMGAPMSRNLLKAGFSLKVWNRSIAKAEPLAADGAVVCAELADVLRDVDVIITMLSDGGVVGGLIEQALANGLLKPGATWLDMSSIKPDEARAHAAALGDAGFCHLDAPVSGGTKGAEAGTLAIMVGGDGDVVARMQPVFAAMGRPVHVGPSGAGQLSKLANQAIVAATISVVAEAMLFTQKGGADPAAVREALKGGFADSVILQQHGARMTEGNFVPGGLSKFQLKDLDNLLLESEGMGLELPVAQMARDRFTYFCAEMDGGDVDHSGIYLELLKRNGVSA